MLGDALPLRVADLAGARGQVAAQKLAEIAFADEADAGGILLGMGRQAGILGNPAQRAFSRSPIGNRVAANCACPN